jgi:hypothetical protein
MKSGKPTETESVKGGHNRVNKPQRSMKSGALTCTAVADKHQGPKEGPGRRRRQQKKSSSDKSKKRLTTWIFFFCFFLNQWGQRTEDNSSGPIPNNRDGPIWVGGGRSWSIQAATSTIEDFQRTSDAPVGSSERCRR